MARQFVQPDETRRSYHSGLTKRLDQQHVGTVVFDAVDYASYALKGFEEVAGRAPIARNSSVQSFTFETSKYGPPFALSVRSSVDGWGVSHAGAFADGLWTFVLPGAQYRNGMHMKLVLADAFWMVGEPVWVPPIQDHRHFTDTDVFLAYEFRYLTATWRPNHMVTLRNSFDGWGRDVFGVFENDGWTILLDRAIYPDSFSAKLMLDRAHFMAGADLAVDSSQSVYMLSDAQVVFPGTPKAHAHGYDNFMPLETPLEQVTMRSRGREDEKYDAIVIGSGMGGGIVADALADRGARVLVLDAGGLWFPVQINELPSIDVDLARRDEIGHFKNKPGSGSDFKFGVQFNLGGRSCYWSGVIPRMCEWEMRGKWPTDVRNYLFNVVDGLSGYDRAEQLMRKGRTLGPFQRDLRDYLQTELVANYDVIDLPRSLHQPNIELDGDDFVLQNVLEKPTGVFSTTDLLLDSLGTPTDAGRKHLLINLHHLATKIETHDGDAVAVICQDLIGNVQRRYEAEYIVLACGSLESPKLLINSELGDPADASNLVGKGLTDHSCYFYEKHHELPQTGPLGWIGDARGHAKLLIRHKSATASAHAYNVEVLVNPKYWDARHADIDVWNEQVESQKKSKVDMKFIFSSELGAGNYVKPMGAGQKSEVYVAPNHPDAAYKLEVVNLRNLILQKLGVTETLSTVWKDEEWSQLTQGTVHHAGGTLRMSDDGSGVVDEDLKLEGLERLYCCDVSVFPTIPAANPSLTLAALAQRLADTLAGKLGL